MAPDRTGAPPPARKTWSTRWRGVRPWLFGFGVALLFVIGARAFVVESVRINGQSMFPALHSAERVLVNKLVYALRAPRRGEVVLFESPCDRMAQQVKRIVAVGNDTVEIRCDATYVNGEPVSRGDRTTAECPSERASSPAIGCSRQQQNQDGQTYDVLLSTSPADFPQGNAPFVCPAWSLDPHPVLTGKTVKTGDAGKPCQCFEHYAVPEDHVFVIGDNRSTSRDSRQFGPVPLDHVIGKLYYVWRSSSRERHFVH